MRFLILVSIVVFSFVSCKSSSGKKDKNTDSTVVRPLVITPMTLDKLPMSVTLAIMYNGKFLNAMQWNDAAGDNMLVLSTIPPRDDNQKIENEEEGKMAYLYADHFLKTAEDFQQTWKVSDSIRSCPFDITSEFIKDGTTITDLDKDGLAEITILYRQACRSDVSPAEMKLVMYEGNTKYYLNGLSWLKVSPEDSFTVTEKDVNLETLAGYKKTEDEYMKTFGRYESEKGFADAPPEFLAYARKQWMKFVIETIE